MTTETVETLHGFYSDEAAKRFGSIIYETPDGKRVHVTYVNESRDPPKSPDYSWIDVVYMGEVKKGVIVGHCPAMSPVTRMLESVRETFKVFSMSPALTERLMEAFKKYDVEPSNEPMANVRLVQNPVVQPWAMRDPNDDGLCEMCSRDAGDCACPACPTCSVQGDPDCVVAHGLVVQRDPKLTYCEVMLDAPHEPPCPRLATSEIRPRALGKDGWWRPACEDHRRRLAVIGFETKPEPGEEPEAPLTDGEQKILGMLLEDPIPPCPCAGVGCERCGGKG